MNYRLLLQYDGTRYNGWQRQGNTSNTIQAKVEAVLSQLAGQPIELQGAGRTDAGVHAQGQVASVRLPQDLPPLEVRAYLNRYLPEDIAVTEVQEAGERFHARLNATGKTYRYAIRLGDTPDVFRRKYQYRVEAPLDIAAMERAAVLLTGTNDYRSFCSNRRFKKSTRRTVDTIALSQQGADLTITFHGNGFLYHMVRILTGTLLEVGLGARTPEEMPAILAAQDRSAAGHTAPALGLTLVSVDYN